jgi:hypothetical protein
MPTMPLTGHCLCGAVTYTCDAEPAATAVCHCDDCQRSSGSAFSVNILVPRAALAVEGETLATFETTGTDTGLPRQRQFCSACGSPVVTMLEEMPEVAIVKAGTLDDRSWLEPAMEVWCERSQPWVAAAGEQRMTRGLGSAAAA